MPTPDSLELPPLPIGVETFDLEGVKWVSLAIAAASWKCDRVTASQMAKRGHRPTGLKKLKSIRRRVLTGNGKHASIAVFLRNGDVKDVKDRLEKLRRERDTCGDEVPIQEAARELKVSVDLLEKLSLRGSLLTPRLNIVRRKRIYGGALGGTASRHLSRQELDRLKGFLDNVHVRMHPRKGKLIDQSIVRQSYGFGANSCAELRLHGSPILNGEKLFGQKMPTLGPGPRKRWFFQEDYFTRLVAKLDESTGVVLVGGVPHVLVSAAAKRWNVTTTTVYDWSKNGCPALGGEPLEITPQTLPVGACNGAKASRKVGVIPEQMVSAIDASRRGTPGSGSANAETGSADLSHTNQPSGVSFETQDSNAVSPPTGPDSKVYRQRLEWELRWKATHPDYDALRDASIMRSAYAKQYRDDLSGDQKGFENARRWARRNNVHIEVPPGIDGFQ